MHQKIGLFPNVKVISIQKVDQYHKEDLMLLRNLITIEEDQILRIKMIEEIQTKDKMILGEKINLIQKDKVAHPLEDQMISTEIIIIEAVRGRGLEGVMNHQIMKGICPITTCKKKENTDLYQEGAMKEDQTNEKDTHMIEWHLNIYLKDIMIQETGIENEITICQEIIMIDTTKKMKILKILEANI